MELKERIPDLKFSPGPGSELPSPVSMYKFYLCGENPWTFKTKKIIFQSLNDAGFDKIFVEKAPEPEWAERTQIGRSYRERGDFWVVEHIPDASNSSDGNISLVDDLRHDLVEKYYALHDYNLREVIQTEIGEDEVFDQKHVPRPKYESRILEILGQHVSKTIRDEFDKDRKTWDRVLEYHKQL